MLHHPTTKTNGDFATATYEKPRDPKASTS